VVGCRRFEQGAEWEGNEHGEAFPDAEDLMPKDVSGSDERECQKLIPVVAVGASEFVSHNQLIKCDLPTMKNGEMTPRSDSWRVMQCAGSRLKPELQTPEYAARHCV